MVTSDASVAQQKHRFFISLANTAAGLDPSGRLESVAYLLVRLGGAPRYNFHLKAGRPASWSFLTDLGTVRWQADFVVGDPIDRISSLQFKTQPFGSDAVANRLKALLSGFDARKLDQLAGLVFVHDLLASTGRPAEDEAVLEKYWHLVPEKTRPKKDELPVEAAREIYALAA